LDFDSHVMVFAESPTQRFDDSNENATRREGDWFSSQRSESAEYPSPPAAEIHMTAIKTRYIAGRS